MNGRVLSEEELNAEYQTWHNALMLLGDSEYENVARPTIEQAIEDRNATIGDLQRQLAEKDAEFLQTLKSGLEVSRIAKEMDGHNQQLLEMNKDLLLKLKDRDNMIAELQNRAKSEAREG